MYPTASLLPNPKSSKISSLVNAQNSEILLEGWYIMRLVLTIFRKKGQPARWFSAPLCRWSLIYVLCDRTYLRNSYSMLRQAVNPVDCTWEHLPWFCLISLEVDAVVSCSCLPNGIFDFHSMQTCFVITEIQKALLEPFDFCDVTKDWRIAMNWLGARKYKLNIICKTTTVWGFFHVRLLNPHFPSVGKPARKANFSRWVTPSLVIIQI